jgi:hypothetical protein
VIADIDELALDLESALAEQTSAKATSG